MFNIFPVVSFHFVVVVKRCRQCILPTFKFDNLIPKKFSYISHFLIIGCVIWLFRFFREDFSWFFLKLRYFLTHSLRSSLFPTEPYSFPKYSYIVFENCLHASLSKLFATTNLLWKVVCSPLLGFRSGRFNAFFPVVSRELLISSLSKLRSLET